MTIGFRHMKNNNQPDKQTKELQGDIIKDIFESAKDVAELHAALTSPRGEFFREKLLSLLGDGLSYEEIEELRHEFGLEESRRHIHKLLSYGFIEKVNIDAKEEYHRTELGEEAINAVRELERKLTKERADRILKAGLGKNSIRLFLKIYGSPKKTNGENIVYTPLQIGQISAFLPRTIEGIAAIDKLDDAGLVSYMEDGNIHVNPRRSTVFYFYLKNLYALLQESSSDVV